MLLRIIFHEFFDFIKHFYDIIFTAIYYFNWKLNSSPWLDRQQTALKLDRPASLIVISDIERSAGFA